jgi:hypothetical protein
MAALLGNADARALLLAAIMVMAMVLSPADPAQAQGSFLFTCFFLHISLNVTRVIVTFYLVSCRCQLY